MDREPFVGWSAPDIADDMALLAKWEANLDERRRLDAGHDARVHYLFGASLNDRIGVAELRGGAGDRNVWQCRECGATVMDVFTDTTNRVRHADWHERVGG